MRGLDGWRSEVRASLGGKSEELERLAVEMYARGLSMRDIAKPRLRMGMAAACCRASRRRGSPSGYGPLSTFAKRDLSELDIVYLFIDGVAARLHLGQSREAVLAAWDIDASGTKYLLGLQPGTKEDTACCRDFLRDLKPVALLIRWR